MGDSVEGRHLAEQFGDEAEANGVLGGLGACEHNACGQQLPKAVHLQWQTGIL